MHISFYSRSNLFEKLKPFHEPEGSIEEERYKKLEQELKIDIRLYQ